MSDRRLLTRGRFVVLFTGIVSLSNCAAAMACSVCQGNPDSKLVKGAEAGVLLMVFVTYGLLFGMIGLGATWFVRHRRNLRRAGGIADES